MISQIPSIKSSVCWMNRSAIQPALRCCDFANSRADVKVLLSGEGSDEILAGYEGRYAGMMATMSSSRSMRMLAPILPTPAVHASASRWDRLLHRARSSPATEAVQLRIEGLPGDIRTPRGMNHGQLAALRQRMSRSADSFSPAARRTQLIARPRYRVAAGRILVAKGRQDEHGREHGIAHAHSGYRSGQGGRANSFRPEASSRRPGKICTSKAALEETR